MHGRSARIKATDGAKSHLLMPAAGIAAEGEITFKIKQVSHEQTYVSGKVHAKPHRYVFPCRNVVVCQVAPCASSNWMAPFSVFLKPTIVVKMRT